MLYRLFTENKNKEGVCRVTSSFFDGFTIYEAAGYWKGEKEESLLIEIVADGKKLTFAKIKDLAEKIKEMNSQECILVEKIENHSHLV